MISFVSDGSALVIDGGIEHGVVPESHRDGLDDDRHVREFDSSLQQLVLEGGTEGDKSAHVHLVTVPKLWYLSCRGREWKNWEWIMRE